MALSRANDSSVCDEWGCLPRCGDPFPLAQRQADRTSTAPRANTQGLGGEKLVPWIYSQMEKHRNMSKSDPSDS